MANNHSRFAEMIQDVNHEEKAWFTKELVHVEDQPDFPEDAKKQEEFTAQFAKERGIDSDAAERWPDFEYRFKDSNFYLYNEESFNLDCIVALIQRFLRRFRPDDIFKMTWAETCSAPRVSEFGGGWCVITASDTEYGNTWAAADEMADEMATAMKET